MTTKQINEKFNRLAESIGCKARVKYSKRNSARYGRKTSVTFYEVIGITSDGYEKIVKIDAHRFSVLTAKYDALDIC